jgi:putative membrane protein
MAVDTPDRELEQFEVRLTSDSHFAWLRTRMALERTQMAWVRTGVSLIAFGFTIYQVLDRLPGREAAAHPRMPLYLGLSLIATGIIALVIAALDYRSAIDYLWSPQFRKLAGIRGERRIARVLPITLILLGVGIAAFVVVLFRVP